MDAEENGENYINMIIVYSGQYEQTNPKYVEKQYEAVKASRLGRVATTSFLLQCLILRRTYSKQLETCFSLERQK